MPHVQDAGNVGRNWTLPEPSLTMQSPRPTPSSPVEKITLAPCAEPHEQVAQRYCIVFREILLDVAIRRADRLWDLWLVDHVFEPLEVALLASADGAVVDEWGRVRASDASVYWVSTFASWLGSPGTRRFPPRICTRVNAASSPSMRCLFMKVVRSSLLG